MGKREEGGESGQFLNLTCKKGGKDADPKATENRMAVMLKRRDSVAAR